MNNSSITIIRIRITTRSINHPPWQQQTTLAGKWGQGGGKGARARVGVGVGCGVRGRGRGQGGRTNHQQSPSGVRGQGKKGATGARGQGGKCCGGGEVRGEGRCVEGGQRISSKNHRRQWGIQVGVVCVCRLQGVVKRHKGGARWGCGCNVGLGYKGRLNK